ncbi:unnamed protein product [Arctia plantaginis]|uniref:Uncharacterized protein n=1 Tax=Arctia plantaginis TaxID=874455 RepID=A0A8S1AL64_ARCPL|nr:unnamed protein product [Arctia plantaginis]
MKHQRNNTVAFNIGDFPPLGAGPYVRQQPPSSRSQDPENIGYWNKKQENTQSQPTSSLEQIIIKQSEIIDTLIQQMGTIMGLLTTIIAQYKK